MPTFAAPIGRRRTAVCSASQALQISLFLPEISLLSKIISLLIFVGNLLRSGCGTGAFRSEIASKSLEIVKFPVNFPVILRLGDDPKFVAVDDAEVVGDSIAEAVPVLGNRVFQKFQNCSLELPEGFVVPVMGRVLVHESPTLFDRIEMGTIWRDEVQHGFSVLHF